MNLTLKIFLITNVFTISFLVFLGIMNMVVRMGLSFSLDIVFGPAVAGLFMGTALTLVIKKYINKIKTVESEKQNVLVETQRDVIYKLGEIVESRSKETGLHVKRVAEYSKLLGTLHGLTEYDSEMLTNASPMHDIGKVGIPDYILLKPGTFTPEEYEVMKSHTTIGYELLKSSSRELLRTAAIISYHHHENWDGSGYPQGLKGRSIHLFGRITAIADVFDALSVERSYKKSWSLERIIEFMKENKGVKFDPVLLDLFLHNLEKFIIIGKKFEDKFQIKTNY
ncbi:MAG: HD domain-containing protein [Spirochaetia bacterium]|nr:HD domain-containing protein [Spirochaetia bacterium]